MLYIIRGIPGSDKSNIAKKLLESNTVQAHYEADQFFTDSEGRYFFRREKIRAAHKWCQESVKKALKEGKAVAVSNTFTQRWEILKYVDICTHLGIRYKVLVATGDTESTCGISTTHVQVMKDRWEDWEGEIHIVD